MRCDQARQIFERDTFLGAEVIAGIDAFDAGDEAWPKTASACSLGTPARLMSERAVRRQSCKTQP